MANIYYNTVIDHSNDAGFRAWASELSNALESVGLVRTSDTGQADLSTATKPAGVNAFVNQVFRFNDSQQSSKPIYIKVFFGNGTNLQTPVVKFAVGTSTDGAGNLSNTVADFFMSITSTILNNTVNYPTYISLVNGCLNIAFKVGAGSADVAPYFFIHRSQDAETGLADTNGFIVYANAPSSTALNEITQVFKTDNTWGTRITSNSKTGFVPLNSSDPSFIGADAQVYLHYIPFPRVTVHTGFLSVKATEFGKYSTFIAKPIGDVTRTYLVTTITNYTFTTLSNSHHLAMYWE